MKAVKKSPAPIKGILFDPDSRLLRYLKDEFAGWKKELQLTLESNASNLLEELKIMRPAFLVISWEDIEPALRENILRECLAMKNAPKVVALIKESSVPDEKPSSWGVSQVIDKPFSAALLRSSLLSMFEGSGTKKRIEGHLKNFSLSSLLQILHLEKKTCRLEISNDDFRGTVWLNEGNVTEAKTDAKTSFEAAMEILALDIVNVDILQEKKKSLKPSIKQGLPGLLLEAAHQKDEKAARK